MRSRPRSSTSRVRSTAVRLLRRRRRSSAYGTRSLRRKHSHRRAYYRLTYACLVLSEILYLPALLALPRMFVCAVPFDELFPSITEVGNPYTNHGGAALLKWIFFTATGRSSSRPTAATTQPNPPLPSILSSS